MSDFYIGLMSGTSLDGIDAALVQFDANATSLIATNFEIFPDETKKAISASSSNPATPIETLGVLDAELGNLFAECSKNLLVNANLKPSEISAIGCHGLTLYHDPYGPIPFTLQIGDPNRIAEITGITTIADFRRRDIAAGGQGAPMVPGFHEAVFRCANETRVIVNIGGIANITVLPKQIDRPVFGFDTGPGNTFLDFWAKKHINTDFDKNGDWARTGKLHATLYKALRDDEYFSKSPPKSTGKEYFSPNWLEAKLAHITTTPSAEDTQNTLSELTAATICEAINLHVDDSDQILVCGGGAHNSHLLELIRRSAPCAVDSTNLVGFDPDWIEAMAFAWLGKMTLTGQAGNLPSVTGAKHPTILGGIYQGQNAR